MNVAGITITSRKSRDGTLSVTAALPGGDSFTDKIDVADADARAKFVRSLCKGRKGIDKAAVSAELERIATETVSSPGRPSQADALVALAKAKAELFHTPGGHDSEGYATIEVNGHLETWPISTKGFKRWLSRLYWEQDQKAPNSEGLKAALILIASMAVHDGKEHPVAVRVAEHEGSIYLDLANDKWQTVEISTNGWRIVANPSVKFIRPRGMLSLPVPDNGGHLDELRAMVNLPDDDAWRLFVAWLVASLRPGRPFPVLTVNGEQGSAKSTLCRMGKALVDPNQAALRRPPRNDRDLMIAATNGWIVAYDNLSGIPAALSDAICVLATGGGFSTRELHTDGNEKLFDAMRPVMLNGIEDLATRADLLDRSINLTLGEIPDNQRRDEDELWQGFEQARPRILGALLDAVSAALRNRASVRLLSKPRMADFACWIVAAEPSLPWPPGAFLRAYTVNRGAANALAIESSIVAAPILSLMAQVHLWQGTAADLLHEIETNHTDDKTRKRKDWPTSPRKLSGELRRLAPNLRRVGIVVTFGTHTRKGTPIKIEQTGKTPSPLSPPSPPPKSLGNHGVGGNGQVTNGDDGDERRGDRHPDRHLQNADNRGDNGRCDDGDDGDGDLHTQSDSGENAWGDV